MSHSFFNRLFIFLAAVLPGFVPLAKGAADADIVIGYAATWGNSVGGADNVEVIAANTVAGANAIYARSGAPPRMRVVGCYQSAQDNTNRTSTGGIVGWLNNYDSRISDVVDYGNAMGADLVTYVCTNNDSATIGAVAGQPGRYSCFNPGAFWSTVFCHEAGGHNYGCDHRGGDDNPKTVMMHNYCGGGANAYFSNPNIWLNSARLQGTSTCLGAAVDGGDNAYVLSNNAQGRADAYGRVISAPALSNVVRRWALNQPVGAAPAGTTVTDSVSGTALATVQGAGATFTGEGLRIPGGTGGSGAAYLQLPGALVSGYTNATIEIWAKTISVQNWARVMDFNNGTGNYLLLAASRGTNLSTQRFESQAAAKVSLDSDVASATNVMYHYAITFADNGAGGGRWTWFRDGDVIAFLDVAYTLSAFQDVNNWLGRSAFGGDSYANAEYAEVRISNIAMSRTQVAANARLGPNRGAKNASLTDDDPIGQDSFAAAGRWSDGLAPGAGKTYEGFGFRLRTPADGVSRTFAGQSLTMNGGSLTWKGTSGSTNTINNLTLAGTDGEVLNAGSGTWTLAGSMNVQTPEVQVRAANGPIALSTNLSGAGTLMLLNNTVTFSGNNAAFTGKTVVGDGRFSNLAIDSEARLGANPASFVADQLTFNRGVLYTTVNLTIDDSNRGIRIGESAALFNVAGGTTLTIAVPVSSPSSGAAVLAAPQFPNPAVGILIKDNSGTLTFTHPNNSHVGEIVINGGTLSLTGAGRFNNGDTPMPVVNNATLLIDSTGNQAFGGVISGGGAIIKSNTGTMTLFAANTFTGALTINGGTVFANAANAANNRNLSFTSGVTVNNGATLRASANALFGWDGTQEKPITVNAGGTLLADGGGTGDVGVGSVTLNGGTLASTTASTAYGTWRFDNATDKLAVTADSTVSAVNVKFGDPAAAVEVAAGRTCNFTGTITNGTSGGTSYLRKTGAGTLNLSAVNTYTGTTTVEAGTLVVGGNNSSAIGLLTVYSGATLGGNGNVGGNVVVGSGGRHALAVAAWPGAQVTRTIGGALDLTAVGDVLDLTAAIAPATGSYTLATATGGITGTLGDTVMNLTGITNGSVAVVGNSLVLTVAPASAYSAWASSSGLNGSNNGATQDPDFDGIANLLEFALGGNPLAADTGNLPKPSEDTTNFYFDFDRRDDSVTEVTLTFEYSTALDAWPSTVAIPSNNNLITGPPVSITDKGGGSHHLKVTVAKSGNAKVFGRLKAVK